MMFLHVKAVVNIITLVELMGFSWNCHARVSEPRGLPDLSTGAYCTHNWRTRHGTIPLSCSSGRLVVNSSQEKINPAADLIRSMVSLSGLLPDSLSSTSLSWFHVRCSWHGDHPQPMPSRQSTKFTLLTYLMMAYSTTSTWRSLAINLFNHSSMTIPARMEVKHNPIGPPSSWMEVFSMNL